jgi:Family of unknown function (DUF5719)
MSLRGRLVAVAVAIMALAATGVALDHVIGARALGSGSAEGPTSGAWYCPHGGSSGWQAWIVLTNPGPSNVRVRLTQLTRGGVRSVATFTVPAVREIYRPVSADDAADATAVEYFGGWVGASAVLSSDSPSGLAAERCEAGPRRTAFLLDEPTGAGDTAYLVVMNPFAADAAFDVVIRTEQRTIPPGPLSPYVLKGRTSVAIRLNDFALEGPGEQTVTAQVTEQIGRVVVGELVQSFGGIRAEAGGAEPARTIILPAGGFVGQPDLILFNPQRDRADVSVTSSGKTGQRVVSGPEPISLAPGEVKTVGFAEFEGAGAEVRSDNKEPVVATLRVTGPQGDPATVVGTAAGAGSWLVMPCAPPEGGKSFLVLQNPGHTDLRLSVQLIGTDGAVPAPRLSFVLLPAGRTITIGLSGPAKGRPVSALVRAESGTFVAGGASYARGGAGYGVTIGLPMKEA